MLYRLKEPIPAAFWPRKRAPRERYTVPTHAEWLMGRLFDGLFTPSVLSEWAEEAAEIVDAETGLTEAEVAALEHEERLPAPNMPAPSMLGMI